MYKKNFIVLAIALCGFSTHIFADPADLDPTFNAGGVQPGTIAITIPGTTDSRFEAVAMQADGKIVVAGPGLVGGLNQFMVARFNTDGTFDTTFNGSGSTTTTIGGLAADARALAVAIQADGKIVVVGHADTDTQFGIARFNVNGTLDTTFNPLGAQQGTRAFSFSGGTDVAEAVAMQADGKIVVAGTALSGGTLYFAVARLNPNGSLDTTFNGSGTTTETIGGPSNDSAAHGVAIQKADGKIVVAGVANISGTDEFGVARFNTNGTLDTTFNAGGSKEGTASTTIDNVTGQGQAVVIQKDGKIVVAGSADTPGSTKFGVARFNTNGTLDTTFNGGGIQQGTALTTIDNSTDNLVQAVALQVNGKIVIAGLTLLAGFFQFGVARFNTDGTLDATFNGGIEPGTTSTTIQNLITSSGFGVAIQKNGRIVVVGEAGTLSAIARFEGDFIIATSDLFALRLIEKYGPRL